jgi:2-methylcitrate dehydratase
MSKVILGRDTNQALGIGQFALDFLAGKLGTGPSEKVLQRCRQFHTDSVLCGASALALQTNAPTLLRAEALEYVDPRGATVLGGGARVRTEKAVVANSSAVREWDSNGTNFGYNPALGHVAGEFGHNDFYPVAIAACQAQGLDGATALRAMVLIDEIRGRLAEVFSLKTYKIDHVVHGAIASAATYVALCGGTAEQAESAIGMFVAHYIPWRAIRAGKQLSDSKGASAAISTEAAVLCAKRALKGFVGPKDIFRNPEALFRQFEPTDGSSPFDLHLSHSGDDFAVMGMHFKLGLYEHQSAGALQGAIDLLIQSPNFVSMIEKVVVKAYEPAFGIIGDPAKRDPKTRQSADHSMIYIVATLLRKASEKEDLPSSSDELWKALMLAPKDYGHEALLNPATRAIMNKIEFAHGGAEYDAKYPDGIPTSVVVTLKDGSILDSGLVMYPGGHARNTTANLDNLLAHKAKLLAEIAFTEGEDIQSPIDLLDSIESMSSPMLLSIYDLNIARRAAID